MAITLKFTSAGVEEYLKQYADDPDVLAYAVGNLGYQEAAAAVKIPTPNTYVGGELLTNADGSYTWIPEFATVMRPDTTSDRYHDYEIAARLEYYKIAGREDLAW